MNAREELKYLQEERDILFDENFRIKLDDIDRIKKFCKVISNITNIQVCTEKGMLYEYIDKVYKGAIHKLQDNQS